MHYRRISCAGAEFGLTWERSKGADGIVKSLAEENLTRPTTTEQMAEGHHNDSADLFWSWTRENLNIPNRFLANGTNPIWCQSLPDTRLLGLLARIILGHGERRVSEGLEFPGRVDCQKGVGTGIESDGSRNEEVGQVS